LSTSPSRIGKQALYTALAQGERLLRPAVDTSPQALRSIHNFLLLQYQTALGTAIHATPVMEALRTAVPQARIVVAGSGFSLEVLRNNPAVDLLMETPSPLVDLRGALRLVRDRKLFNGEQYATIVTVGNERTPITTLALLAGPSIRIGYTVAPKLFNRPLSFDYAFSQIENNLRTVRELGYPTALSEPKLFPNDEDDSRAQMLLSEAGVMDGAPIAILVTQTSVTQYKSWRAERFAAAARHLRERYGAHILFVGTAGESAAIDGIRNQLGFASASLAGSTTIGVLAAVLRKARIGITLDTGTLHIGRSVGLPMVIIAPAWSPVVEWLPVDNPRYRILKNADMPRQTQDYIIDEVSIHEVNAATDDLMATTER